MSETFQFLTIAAFYLGIYLFTCWCFYRIALKAGITERLWWAWFPIFQVFLIVRVIGMPWWWVLLLLIPLINVFMALSIAIKLAQRFNKSAWLGVALVIPGLNFFVLAHLAFSYGAQAGRQQ